MREHTLGEFRANLDRVENLISVYDVLQERGQGRRSVMASDTLRASIVFLHSALEEVIRNLFLWKLPEAESEKLNEIPLVGTSPTNRQKPFLLGELAPHRGLFVHNVIRDSIKFYVDHMNINNVRELCHCLEMVGLPPDGYRPHFRDFEAMMGRRHQIVHQMDRNHDQGVGRHRAQSISRQQVMTWKDNLSAFVNRVVQDLPD